jgi:hypothetical protein
MSGVAFTTAYYVYIQDSSSILQYCLTMYDTIQVLLAGLFLYSM